MTDSPGLRKSTLYLCIEMIVSDDSPSLGKSTLYFVYSDDC